MFKKLFGIVTLTALLSVTFASAQVDPTASTPVVTSPAPVTQTQTVAKKAAFDPTCMQNAVDKRDSALIAAVDKYAAAAKTALETRKSALKESWAKPTAKERASAIRAAWAAYRKAIAAAKKTFRKEKKNVWAQFYKDRKACKQAGNPDTTNESVDNDL